jgi:rhodanese-related sulfurtransferase
MKIQLAAIAMTAALICQGTAADADEPYCGLYASHAVLHALGHDVEFETLVTADNLTGSPGSTALDLLEILREHDLNPVYRTSMGIHELRTLQSPAILHTKPAMVRAEARHWVAFLGYEDGRMKIYDPPSGIELLKPAELMIQWDGTAVLAGPSGAAGWWPNGHVALGLLAAAAVTILISDRMGKVGRSVLLMPVASITVAAVWHFVVDYGFIGNAYAVRSVVAHSDESSNEFPVVGSDELRRLQLRDDVTIIDARRPDDFEFLHIDGSVNVPISSSHGDFKNALQQIPENHQLVFYCQSDQCTWAEKVAKRFSYYGYDRIVIYRDGFVGWQQYLREEESARPGEIDTQA